MKVTFKRDCNFKGKKYITNDELEITRDNYCEIWHLNEQGFIYPINYKKYTELEKKLNKVGEELNEEVS